MKGRRDLRFGPEQLVLKNASRDLVRAAGGPTAVSQLIGYRQQRISDCTLRNAPDFLRIDEAAGIEDITVNEPGWPHVTRALCHRAGGMFVPLPQADVGTGDWTRALADVSREFHEITQRVCKALADGEVTADEVVDLDLRAEIREAQGKLAIMDALAAKLAGENDTS